MRRDFGFVSQVFDNLINRWKGFDVGEDLDGGAFTSSNDRYRAQTI